LRFGVADANGLPDPIRVEVTHTATCVARSVNPEADPNTIDPGQRRFCDVWRRHAA
jgi:hypothetical protein